MTSSKRFCVNAVCIALLISAVTARSLHDLLDPYDQAQTGTEDSIECPADGKQTKETI